MPASLVEIEAKVTKIISDILELQDKDIDPEAQLTNDLGADSLHRVEIIMALENSFDLEISQTDAESILSLRQAIEYIHTAIR
jgi:acyl carrier protein